MNFDHGLRGYLGRVGETYNQHSFSLMTHFSPFLTFQECRDIADRVLYRTCPSMRRAHLFLIPEQS